jgi:peroxiredoxin
MSSEAPSAVTVGTQAPDFSLPSTGNTIVSLSSFRSHKAVLIAFFPKAFTSVCTSELCAFSDDFDAFAGLNVEVRPISVDTVEVLQQFRDAHGMRVQLLSDVGGAVARQFGAMWTDGLIANRAYFLIDPAGVVQWAHIEQHPGLRRENEEIFEKIKSVI